MIFMGHFGMARAFLASSSMRAASRGVIVSCVLEILIIQLLFQSDSTPKGITLTFPTCLLFGMGFMLCCTIAAIPILMVIEFPFYRLIQYTIMPLLSHDEMLRDYYMPEKKKLIAISKEGIYD